MDSLIAAAKEIIQAITPTAEKAFEAQRNICWQLLGIQIAWGWAILGAGLAMYVAFFIYAFLKKDEYPWDSTYALTTYVFGSIIVFTGIIILASGYISRRIYEISPDLYTAKYILKHIVGLGK